MNEAYRREAAALDGEIRGCIERLRVPNFTDLALRIFAHQLTYNEPYARYCASLGVTLDAMPASWDAIPPVPAAAFKEATLCTFDPQLAELAFQTSGTTLGTGGLHYMEHAALYDAALLQGFCDRFPAGMVRMRYLLFVPNPAKSPRSSLGYMMQQVAATLGAGDPRWFLEGETIALNRFIHDVRGVQAARVPAFLGGTSFSLLQLVDALGERMLALPPGSWVMETGGFKGRTRAISRSELYARLERTFNVAPEHIVSEYGMTELSSQYYAAAACTADRQRMIGPPWLRSYAVGIGSERLAKGMIGALVHVDLANRSSCIAVQTEDLGAIADEGLLLIGREHGAELRGCSLDAESLRVRS